MQSSIFFSLLLFLAMLSTMSGVSLASYSYSLGVGFYSKTCPNAEAIVKKAVDKALAQNPGLGAGLVRMHFHDCFVRGCDGSVLLDSTPGNPAEKESAINNPSLRGFEVIDEAKAELEDQCPGTVSCADIVAFAARDSSCKLGGIDYEVQSGRRDGRISLEADPDKNLPKPFFDVQQLQDNFAKKGLSLKEMVVLSGSHSLGVTHCLPIITRLYFFNATQPQDPSLDPWLADVLKAICPNPGTNISNLDPITAFPLDFSTPFKMDNVYYRNLQRQQGVLTSDQTLMTTPATARMVGYFGKQGKVWGTKFAKAMVHMGTIEVLTGTQGEIRRNCRVVNDKY